MRSNTSISAGGSSPLVNRACRWGMGGDTVCLFTTLSRYLKKKRIFHVLHSHLAYMHSTSLRLGIQCYKIMLSHTIQCCNNYNRILLSDPKQTFRVWSWLLPHLCSSTTSPCQRVAQLMTPKVQRNTKHRSMAVKKLQLEILYTSVKFSNDSC